MKFAHLADCHIGGWKDEKLTGLGLEAFGLAMKECIKRNVDFILISGDLFNTALPGIDYIKETVSALRLAKEAGINVYTIAGSHDYSVSGKTMLDVLENAGLTCNVSKFDGKGLKFTQDRKTNAKITGLYGKRCGLEKFDYENLNRKELENENGFKIFMFHSGIKEFMPKSMEDVESMPKEMLPRNFNYYAGGHIHYIFQNKDENSLLAFPGALFPNNFREIEEFHNGGFYIVDDRLNYEFINLNLKDVLNITIDANGKSPAEVTDEILKYKENAKGKIATIRIEGILKEGKPSDIDFKGINEWFSDAYCTIRNTSKLTAKSFEIVEVKENSIEDIENAVVKDNMDNVIELDNGVEKEKIVNELLEAMSIEKQDGEKQYTFEERLIANISGLLNQED